MEAIQIIEKIEENLHVFEALLSPVSVVESAWKPDQSKWSLTEIVCHLVDEEVEDFRARIKHCLQGNEGLPPAIDPVGWVSSRSYTDQDYNKKILEFIKERSTSIQWLRSFIDPDWDSSFEDHHFGTMSAGLFLTNWLAHDYLHIRQITHLKYLYLKEHSSHDLFYAGEWK